MRTLRTLFFDIDGTLLITHRAGSGALEEAIWAEFELSVIDMDVNFGGSTDRYLVGEILKRNGLPTDDETQGRVRRRYASILRGVLQKKGGRVLPGVNDLVGKLSGQSNIRPAVMTGNFPETGRIKLEHFRLDRFFSWISGGDLDVERDNLARRTAEQLRRMYGDDASNDVIVIGDTPKDVRCAHAIDAKCLAVCTGGFDADSLRKSGADWVVEDLAASDVFEILTG